MFEDMFNDTIKEIKDIKDTLDNKQVVPADEVWDTGREQSFWKDAPDTIWKNN